MKRLLIPLALFALSACTGYDYVVPTVSPAQAAGIVAQATADTSAAQAQATYVAGQMQATEGAVSAAATALALTPTAAAMALQMTAEAGAVQATARALIQAATETPAARDTQAAQLAAQATATANADAALRAQELANERALRETQEAQAAAARTQAEQSAGRWAKVWDALTVIAIGVLVCSAVILVSWLRLLTLGHVAGLEAKARKTEAEAAMTLIQRAGDCVIWRDDGGQIQVAQVNMRVPARVVNKSESVPAAGEVQLSVPVFDPDTGHQMDMSGGEDHKAEVVEFLQAVVDYQDERDYPRNKIPRWDALDIGATQWSRVTGYLGDCLTKNPPGSKGTFVNGRFQDVGDLLLRVRQGSVVPG